jgi:hypothetical protein
MAFVWHATSWPVTFAATMTTLMATKDLESHVSNISPLKPAIQAYFSIER